MPTAIDEEFLLEDDSSLLLIRSLTSQERPAAFGTSAGGRVRLFERNGTFSSHELFVEQELAAG